MNILLVKMGKSQNNYWDNTSETFQTYPALAMNIINCVSSGGQVYFITFEGNIRKAFGPIQITRTSMNNSFYVFHYSNFQQSNPEIKQSNHIKGLNYFYDNPGLHGLLLYPNNRFFSINISTPPPRF
jgi:hypothetical protein